MTTCFGPLTASSTSATREYLRPCYSGTSRSSIDPELMVRMLVVLAATLQKLRKFAKLFPMHQPAMPEWGIAAQLCHHSAAGSAPVDGRILKQIPRLAAGLLIQRVGRPSSVVGGSVRQSMSSG